MRNKLNCILLVDDDETDNYIHQLIIEHMNIAKRIVVAESGLEALDFLKKEPKNLPELIFLDINMPAVNGWEFLKRYNDLEIKQNEEPVIVMLTTSENPKDREVANSIPIIKGFNNKPLTKAMLKDILDKHFN